MLRTTAGDLRLEEYELRVDDRVWRVLHAGALVSREDEERFLTSEAPHVPYGTVLWPAAIALAHDVAARPVAGLRVLELGAGTGLPGIVAASGGAARVVQTDSQAVARFVGEKNAKRNGVTIEHRAADWTAWVDRDRYDVILGSDILYAERMHPHLRRIFEANLAPGGTILLSDPFRPGSFALLEAMAEDGYDVRVDTWTVAGADASPRRVGVFALRAQRARWARD